MRETEGEGVDTQQHFEPPFPSTKNDLWNLSPMSHLAEKIIEEERRQKALYEDHLFSHYTEGIAEERKRQEELYERDPFSHWLED